MLMGSIFYWFRRYSAGRRAQGAGCRAQSAGRMVQGVGMKAYDLIGSYYFHHACISLRQAGYYFLTCRTQLRPLSHIWN